MRLEAVKPKVISREVPGGTVSASVTPRRRSPFVDVRFFQINHDPLFPTSYSDITVPKGLGTIIALIGVSWNAMEARSRVPQRSR